MPDGFYYLHPNGDLIYKQFEPEIEPGGFVRCVWPLDTSDRGNAWTILLEALSLGARVDRVRELAAKWKCDSDDLMEFMTRNPSPRQDLQRGARLFILEILARVPDEWFDEMAKRQEGAS